jgi:elongator complex protein 3
MDEKNITEQIIKTLIKSRVHNHDDFWRIVSKISRQNKMPSPPTSKLLKTYRKLVKNGKIKPNPDLEKLLCKRPVRTLSGVAIITVLTKPFKCPGACIYCPNEAGMPKSYLSNEPAAARAKLNKFDPYKQVKMRLEALKANGHPTDKIELIIKGGSWTAYPKKYREWFVAKCFCAGNKTGLPKPYKLVGLRKPSGLKWAQKKNETSKHRIIGLTTETRPDLINEKEILHLRKIGCTRVELGVQTIYDDILKRCHRGHGVKEITKATKLLKDAGFKVDYHLMPGLPGSTFQKDIKMFEEIFTNPNFMPDTIKIYPCTVIPNTPLYNLWKRGKYKPLGDKQLIKMLIKVKSKIIPRFCRIARLIRDIPSPSIAAGNKITNLREYIQKEMRQKNLKCKCLRCREVGHQRFAKIKNQKPKIKNTNKKLKIFIDKYNASKGIEYFLSVEDKDREVVYAFLRLRLLQPPHSPPVSQSEIGGVRGGLNPKCFIPELRGAALIRELHTYGHLVPLKTESRKLKAEIQHTGLGKKLMEKAEEISKKAGFRKMAIISGIGVREYYRKLGYKLEGTYMTRNLTAHQVGD